MKEAAKALQETGVGRRFRIQVMKSFNIETIRVCTAGPNEYGTRYYDSANAAPSGRYLFASFPASRKSLALLPAWNQMEGCTVDDLRNTKSTVYTSTGNRSGAKYLLTERGHEMLLRYARETGIE